MSRQPGGIGWSLEVVRGREVGRRFPLGKGPAVLGNAVGNGDGIDLSGQEGDSPRRMAGRQAVVELGADGPVVRDLESPGGTFVNKRRLLPDQRQPLRDGDLIQLAGVLLKVVAPAPAREAVPAPPPPRPTATASPRPAVRQGPAPAPPATPPRPAPAPRPAPSGASLQPAAGPLAFAIKDGPVCRSWDDFLTVSAQRWAAMREELTSGRLAAYLVSTGRANLAPRPDAVGSPDERLDAWLGSLPTSRPARPELDVHPSAITVRTAPGSRTRRSVRVANVGFRLLRSTARVEPADAGWLVVAPEFARPFATVEETDVTFEVAAPEPMPTRLSAALVIDGNGGTARIAVVLEPPGTKAAEPFGDPGGADVAAVSLDAILARPIAWLARRGRNERLIGGALGALLVRLGIGVAGGLSGLATLPGPALVLAASGAVAGAIGASRRGGPIEAPAGAFAGGFGGLIGAAVLVATCQAIEPVLGSSLSGNLVAVSALWAALGAALGGLSLAMVPVRPDGAGGAS